MHAETLTVGIADLIMVIKAIRERITVNLRHVSKESYPYLVMFRDFLTLMLAYLTDLLERELKE